LLKIAGSKFWTSLAGLFASTLLDNTFFGVQSMKVSEACENFLLILSKVVSPAGGEIITLHQLAVADKNQQSSNDSNALAEELLNEAREQTGTFKRFETDLAVSLASAINQAFTPQMQAMTERLVASIEGLSEKMGTMNQEALKTMLGDFAGMLKQATDAEMTQLQQTLQDLSNQLHGAGSMLEIQSGMAANAILNAGVEMQTQLKGAGDTLSAQTAEVATVIQTAGTQLAASTQEMSENLVQGAHQLEQATASIRLGFKDLGEVVELASAKGKEGIAQIHIALEKADLTVTQLSQTASGLSETAQGLVETGALVSNMVDNVQELAREQRAVVLSVREVVPNAMAAVQRVTEVLDQAAAQTLSSMQQTHQAMESTATALGKTVGSITEGAGVLAVRTQEMSENLVQGAHQLEQATASIRLGFKDLGEVVELASTKGKEGIAQVHIALEKADLTVAQLSQTASGLSETAQGLVETGALVSNMVDNVQELAREQRAVVLSVKEVAPNAMAAVERVTEVLDQAAAQTLSSMQQTRQAMESTATTLGKTVGSITEGVGVYSTQVAELHRQMDGQLAKAVGSFDQGVKDLSEVVEELTESLQSTVKTVRR
jgi:translation initiation factor 2 alpha subunit (eIF-2alpha)